MGVIPQDVVNLIVVLKSEDEDSGVRVEGAKALGQIGNTRAY